LGTPERLLLCMETTHRGTITNGETVMNKEQPATKQRDFVIKESKGNSNDMSGRHGQT